MNLPQLISAAAAAAFFTLSAGCNCGRVVLVGIPDQPEVDQGDFVGCGNGTVEAPEACDFGVEGNLGEPGGCNVDCTIVEPVDAGVPAIDAGQAPYDAGLTGTNLVGTIWEAPGAILPTALHPLVPIPQTVVHLHLAGVAADLTSDTTQADGKFGFVVQPGVDFELTYDLPATIMPETNYRRPILALTDGETRVDDYRFIRKGLHWRVSDITNSSTGLEGVEVTVKKGSSLLSGPKFTDVEGYVYFDTTSEPGEVQFVRTGYRTYRLGVPSLDTTHTVVGGCGLTPE